MNRNDAKNKLIETLLSKYDEREAKNIAEYYLDSKVIGDYSELQKDISKFQSGHPVQYITNTSFFYGHKLYVDEHTLIPRPETEELVHWIISDNKNCNFSLIDIGTGSGCILLSVLHKCNSAIGIGVDVDPQVQKVFDINQQKLNVEAQFTSLDFLDENGWESLSSYDVIVSNPPYISKEEVARLGESVFEHEPHLALFTEDDPLIFYKKTVDFAQSHLKDRGSVYFETSDLYHEEMVSMAEGSGFQFEFRKDMQSAWRMLKLWR
jgi:release factor glutamine methyltransferase